MEFITQESYLARNGKPLEEINHFCVKRALQMIYLLTTSDALCKVISKNVTQAFL